MLQVKPKKLKRPPPVKLSTLLITFLCICIHGGTENLTMSSNEDFVVATQVVLVVISLVWIFTKKKLSVGLIATFLFTLSVVWKWVLMVKKAQSKKMATLFYLENAMKCKVNLGVFGDLMERIWPSEEKVCKAYYEALHVNSFWEVSPIDAFMETVTDVFFKPLIGLGRGLSGFYNEVLSNTPLLWAPVILIVVTLVLVMIIFVLCGYRLRTPLFSIEPSETGPQMILNVRKQFELSEPEVSRLTSEKKN